MSYVDVALSILSGLLLTAGFPKPDLFFLAWVAWIPLLAAVRGKTAGAAFRLGYICGFVHYGTSLYWVCYVVDHFGGLGLPLSFGVLLILCAYLGVYPALFAVAAQRLEGRPFLWVFLLPAVWVAIEWIKAHAVTGFPWGNLGYTQTTFTPLAQIADVTGVYGVSWLVVLGNTALAAYFLAPRLRAGILFAVLLVGAGTLYGHFRLAAVERFQESASPLAVGVVQGNVDQSRKWDPAFQQETLNRYRELSLAAVVGVPRPELLVWPETAVPFFYGVEEKLTAQVNATAGETGVPLLFGSPGVTWLNGRTRLLNKAYLLDMGNRRLSSYAKQHLVPFGEYVPYQKVLFFVQRLVEAAGDFAAGTDSTPIRLNGKSLGGLICYEGIFPDLSRKAVERGATALVNITNDAWYGRTGAPYQLLQMARWRAIEFRVPLIRAANTGVSAIIDATGKILGNIPLEERGFLVRTVHPFRTVTPYARWGDFFAWLCVLVAVCGIGYDILQRYFAGQHIEREARRT